jgi:hypothetical protein
MKIELNDLVQKNRGGFKMFKSILVAALLTASTVAFAKQKESPAQQEQNFKVCVAEDPSWMGRFGKYVISYDLGEAYDICRKKHWPNPKVNAKRTGCHFDGSWHTAGYYCETF